MPVSTPTGDSPLTQKVLCLVDDLVVTCTETIDGSNLLSEILIDSTSLNT